MCLELGEKNPSFSLSFLGLDNIQAAYWNLYPPELIEETLVREQGFLTDTGALVVYTGEFTGRSPKDKYIVRDPITEKTIWWGEVNQPFPSEKFDALYHRMTAYLSGKEIWVRDAYVCASSRYRLNLRVVNEYPWGNLFSYNLFLRPDRSEIRDFQHEWVILCAPGFKANPSIDGTRQHNFTIINFTKKMILIGGSAYTGEIKKSVFTLLNYLLPQEKNVLSMHCSANVGKNNDTAIFFGLSGTGKTTLSADPERRLIGDDEHGWSDEEVFNFEGGCYAKCVNLSQENEPQIFNAIRFGSLLENVMVHEGTKTVNYNDISITENTRVSYPSYYIENTMQPPVGPVPKNIFFLTCDAYGVLPPISMLTREQAMYHFISGYTAKVAGTEMGITEPQTTFSACFGKAFLPLHPNRYAQMLGEKMKKHQVKVWLVNTGWVRGGYGVGERIKLSYTRTLISAALNGKLDKVEKDVLPFFNLQFPVHCEGVPSELLNPREAWKNKEDFDRTCKNLAEKFIENFRQYESGVSREILSASPETKNIKILVK